MTKSPLPQIPIHDRKLWKFQRKNLAVLKNYPTKINRYKDKKRHVHNTNGLPEFWKAFSRKVIEAVEKRNEKNPLEVLSRIIHDWGWKIFHSVTQNDKNVHHDKTCMTKNYTLQKTYPTDGPKFAAFIHLSKKTVFILYYPIACNKSSTGTLATLGPKA